MTRKLFFIALLFFRIGSVVSQESNEPFYVNVFISADKTIYVETKQTRFQEVNLKVAEIIRNAPFKLDQRIVYRIFADKDLQLGYIIDVEQEMLSGYRDDVQMRRYLLNTAELNIDGQNWFDAIDLKKLKAAN